MLQSAKSYDNARIHNKLLIFLNCPRSIALSFPQVRYQNRRYHITHDYHGAVYTDSFTNQPARANTHTCCPQLPHRTHPTLPPSLSLSGPMVLDLLLDQHGCNLPHQA